MSKFAAKMKRKWQNFTIQKIFVSESKLCINILAAFPYNSVLGWKFQFNVEKKLFNALFNIFFFLNHLPL